MEKQTQQIKNHNGLKSQFSIKCVHGGIMYTNCSGKYTQWNGQSFKNRAKQNMINNALEQMFLDWANNFLTLNSFAKYYQISGKLASKIIAAGRNINQLTKGGGK